MRDAAECQGLSAGQKGLSQKKLLRAEYRKTKDATDMKKRVWKGYGKNRRGRREKRQTLQFAVRKILIPVFFVLLGLLVCLLIELAEIRKLASQYAEDTAELYTDQINYDIVQISNELVLVLENNDDIKKLPAGLDSTQGAYYGLLRKIRNQNLVMKFHYREADLFFMYSEKADVLIWDIGTAFGNSSVNGVTHAVREFCRTTVHENSGVTRWDYLETDDGIHMIGWYVKKGNLIGCVVKVEKIFSMLQEMPDNYQVIPYLRKPDGTLILSEACEGKNPALIKSTRNSELYEYRLGSLGELCMYIILDGGTLENVLKMQVLLVFLIIPLLLLCLFLVYRYYQNLMKPLSQFVLGISEMEQEQMINENGKNNILELEAVSEQFRTLLRKIRSLKIAIYEKELNEQRTELEYMQEQIRPHFTLNCLSLIHGIADVHGEEKIARITKELSEYIRYNYRDSGTERDLQEELAHVRTYMELQKLRYGEEAFRFAVIADGIEREYDIPPLVLQTLVENSVLHAVDLDHLVEISLYIAIETYEDGEYLYICVSDTGKGFSKEIMEAVEKDLPIVYNGRKHVGLQNIRKRLKLLYGDRASMTLQNMDEHYGAVVEIRIPQGGREESC